MIRQTTATAAKSAQRKYGAPNRIRTCDPQLRRLPEERSKMRTTQAPSAHFANAARVPKRPSLNLADSRHTR
jgi:hypothetical protein